MNKHVIYKKDTGKVSYTVTGFFDPKFLPATDASIGVDYDVTVSAATHYVENGELKTLENRPEGNDYVLNVETKTWERWTPEPDLADIARAKRSKLLAECDWIVAKSVEAGNPVPQTWQDYRQALRDITTQPGFPENITWPEQPT